MYVRALTVWLLLAAAAAAADPNIEAYAIASKAGREQRIGELRARLKEGFRDPSIRPAQRKQLRGDVRKEIASLEDPLEPYFAPLDLYRAGIGDVGYVETEDPWAIGEVTITIRQVVDETNAILRMVYLVGGGSGPAREVERDVWITGWPTDGRLDGQVVQFAAVLGVTGTKQYVTAGGSSRTIRLVESVDVVPHIDKFTRKDEARNWTAVDDGHDMLAIYVGYEHGRAKLVKLDGAVLRVALKDLVEMDRQFVLLTQRLQKSASADRRPR